MSRALLTLNELVDVYSYLEKHAKQQRGRNAQQVAMGVGNAVLGALTHIAHMVHNHPPAAARTPDDKFYQAVTDARGTLGQHQFRMNTGYQFPLTMDVYGKLMSLIHYACTQQPATNDSGRMLTFLRGKHWDIPKITTYPAWVPPP